MGGKIGSEKLKVKIGEYLWGGRLGYLVGGRAKVGAVLRLLGNGDVCFWGLNEVVVIFLGALWGCDWRFFVKLGKMGKGIWRSGEKSVNFWRLFEEF